MNPVFQRVAHGLSFVFAVTVTAVFLFLAVGLVPYWQEMSGTEVQDWFAGPFTRFSYMMIPVHFLSIASLVFAFLLHRKTGLKHLILLALVALLVCQAFDFTLYGAVLNPALQSQELSPDAALATLDRWDFFHPFSTAAVAICVLALFAAMIKAQPDTPSV